MTTNLNALTALVVKKPHKFSTTLELTNARNRYNIIIRKFVTIRNS